MDRFSTNNAPAVNRLLLPCTIAALALIICAALAVGWTVHCNKLKDANDTLTGANQSLQQEIGRLEDRLTSLADQTRGTVDDLMEVNRTLGNANEKLAAELAGIRQSMGTTAAENLKLIDMITQLHEDARRQTTESSKYIEDLAGAVTKLTEDLTAANSRLDGLLARLQDKTDEAAELALRVNTLVEMVARLRVQGSPLPEAPADPNAALQ